MNFKMKFESFTEFLDPFVVIDKDGQVGTDSENQ